MPPLLTEAAVTRLIESYLGNMRDNYNNWMTNTIKQEKEDWCSDKDPEMDFDGFFHTSSPVIIYQMVDENLQVSYVTNSKIQQNTESIWFWKMCQILNTKYIQFLNID